MNEVLKTIKGRYSCRAFSDRAIDDNALQMLANAAIESPSAMNRQGWHITFVKNKELIDQIEVEGMRVMSELPDQTIYQRIMGRGGKLFYNAAAIAFISIKDEKTNKHARTDLGIVAQNISLAATSLGIDNCHCGMAAFCFSSNKANEFKDKLKIPSGYECDYCVLLGYGKQQGSPHLPDESKLTFID